MKKCSYCGVSVPDDAKFCTGCGASDFVKVCNNCGFEYDNGNFCPKCGVRAGANAKICPDCKTRYFSNACPNCGYNPATRGGRIVSAPTPNVVVIQPPVQPQPVYQYRGRLCNKWTAFLLCLFFGWFGVHRFYEHKIFSGIIYILTFGLFGVGWLIDLILILLKPAKYSPK
ncbi:MAG: NINE protein [Oscillospiraceae bacterium]|nr:NINE protein [Oscillospiraceae bacterium]